MDTVGGYLKSLRSQKQLSLDKVHEDTKIHIPRLELMEDDQLKKLGAYGYARAAVLSYASYLDADQQRVIQLFEQGYPRPDAAINYNLIDEEPVKSFLLPANTLWIALLVILIGIMSIVLYNFNQQGLLSNPFTGLLSNSADSDSTSTHSNIALKGVKTTTNAEDTEKEIAQPQDVVVDTLAALAKAKAERNPALFARKDTTDYVNHFLFKDTQDPLNVMLDK